MSGLLMAGAAAGALLAIIALLVTIAKAVRWGADRWFDDKIEPIRRDVETIKAEFHPNHGTSFYDKMFETLDSVASGVAELKARG